MSFGFVVQISIFDFSRFPDPFWVPIFRDFRWKLFFPKFRLSRKPFVLLVFCHLFVFFQIEIFDFSQFPDPFWFRFSAIFVESWFSKIPAIPKNPSFGLCFCVLYFFFKSRFSTLAHLRFAILQFGIWNAEKVKVKNVWGLGGPWPPLAPLASLGRPWPAFSSLKEITGSPP